MGLLVTVACSATPTSDGTQSNPSPASHKDALAALAPSIDAGVWPSASIIADAASPRVSPPHPDRPQLKGWNCTRVLYPDNPETPYLAFCYRVWETCETERVRLEQRKRKSTDCEFHERAYCVRIREWVSEGEELVCSTTLEECRDQARLVKESDQFDLLHDCIPRD
jgi:hypothetical protein